MRRFFFIYGRAVLVVRKILNSIMRTDRVMNIILRHAEDVTYVTIVETVRVFQQRVRSTQYVFIMSISVLWAFQGRYLLFF